jgi:hypothetical protein
MEGNMFMKGLVVGIIFLFIGVGVQPAFARDTIKTTISETLEDCECQPIRNHNLDRLEKLSIRTNMLLNRVRIFTNIVGILSKNNPEISKEKFEELSNRITTLKELNENLNLYNPTVCLALFLMFGSVMGIGFFYQGIGDAFELMGFEGIAGTFYLIGWTYFAIAFAIMKYSNDLGCPPIIP